MLCFASLRRFRACQKALGITALGFIGAFASAQSPTLDEFINEHFGACVLLPGKATTQSYASSPNNPNDPSTLTSAGLTHDPAFRNYRNPLNKPWSDGYGLLNSLPSGTWVRVDANLWDHFPTPGQGMVFNDRVQNAIVDKLMFKSGTSNPDGARLLWVLVPSVWEKLNGSVDEWSSVIPGPSATRDRYRPVSSAHPSLRGHVRSFVQAVNNQMIYRATSALTATVDGQIFRRVGFQLGNEAGGGNPGGSAFTDVGDWAGLGAVMQGTTNNINFSADNYFRSFTTNPVPNGLVAPAFSFLANGANIYVGNGRHDDQPDGSFNPEYLPYNFQLSPTLPPIVRELTSYKKEMFGPTNQYSWAQNIGSRAFHFYSPRLLWSRYPNLPDTEKNKFLLTVPKENIGRWETPEEYAVRWVNELENAMRLFGGLEMPFLADKIDITETYVPQSAMASQSFQFSTVPAGTDISTLDKCRQYARGLWKYQNSANTPPMPPSRKDCLLAIRNELYNRFNNAGPTDAIKRLGRIFWWGVYDHRPRYQTGLYPGSDDGRYRNFGSEFDYSAVSYNPWEDIRLSPDEVKCLFNVQPASQ